MKSFILLTVALLLPAATQAATVITETFTDSPNVAIPDGDLNGLLRGITPATTIGAIDSITVKLTTTGGWNGDLYAYLWHDGIISILLNRTGRTAIINAGSAATGFTDLTLSDLAAGDIHAVAGSFGLPVTGTYQPDGRAIHPYFSVDTTPRTAPLSVFNGSAAAGEWRLFVADVAGGDQATLTSWSLSITGVSAIPEPASAVGTMCLLASGLLIRRRGA